MNKIKEFLLSRDVILAVLVIMGLRAVIVEPGIGYAISVLGYCALVGVDKYIKHTAKPDLNAELKAEVEALRNNVSGLMMKNASRPAQMQQEIKRFF
jgi:hypothetical protein